MVIAHPMLYRSIDLLMELIDESLLDDIEVWHPKAEDGMTDILLKIALENNLLPTGGSQIFMVYIKFYNPPYRQMLYFAKISKIFRGIFE